MLFFQFRIDKKQTIKRKKATKTKTTATKKEERSESVINANKNKKIVMHNQAARKSSQSTHDYQITTTRLVSVKQKAGVTGAVSATSRSRATTRHIQTLNYLTIFIYILLSVCCFNNVNSHESNYYYYYNSEGDGKLQSKIFKSLMAKL